MSLKSHMGNSTKIKLGRPSIGKDRSQIVNESKSRYRNKMKTEGKVFVSFPITKQINFLIKENAQRYGKSASLLMTEILESAINTGNLLDTKNKKYVIDKLNERDKLYKYFENKLYLNAYLTRQLVSFQESKKTPFYRWLKYKEAFSPNLIEYLLDFIKQETGETIHVLDPFAGTGTVLTRAASRGWKATGIELLPVGTHALKARFLVDRISENLLKKEIDRLNQYNWDEVSYSYSFPHIRITQSAFSIQTEKDLSAYNHFLSKIQDDDIKFIFWFASLSILEDISYTRKDGQYLRWDHRSGRKLARNFNKGNILSFRQAIIKRLDEIKSDISNRNGGSFYRNATIIDGSCLLELPNMESEKIDAIITSPPYCNRYDYTRTYALELAYSGLGEDDVKDLRQSLLSSTVENKNKYEELKSYYKKIDASDRFSLIELAFNTQSALKEVLNHLEYAKINKELSNNNIPNMVHNYFFEMAAVIFEFSRILKPGGTVFMVNDNVRYHGQEVPVDLILSDFAEKAGFEVEKIWVLPKGKGNSSQQMSKWGRVELRKCIYYWKKS